MLIYSDSAEFPAEVLPEGFAVRDAFVPAQDKQTGPLLTALWGRRLGLRGNGVDVAGWNHLCLTASTAHSQCDQLIALSRRGQALPDGIACLARSGNGFHGFKGRRWAAAPGNIHLAAHFAPQCEVERFEVAFTILAALSVVDAIDSVPALAGRAGIRWVNDVVFGEAKVGGVLAYTQTQGRTVTSTVLGIGVNVEATPEVAPTPFVPSVTSLQQLLPGSGRVTLRTLVPALLVALQRNYRELLRAGYRPLLERYRQRSTAIGHQCTVCTEESDQRPTVIASGRLAEIGDGLELYVDGWSRPITRGRLMLGRPAAWRAPTA